MTTSNPASTVENTKQSPFMGLLTGPTIGSVMNQHRGAGPGFDAIRIGLSLAIMFWHCFQISYGNRIIPELQASIFYPLTLSMVPLFFCLSGFLITGSAVRTNSVRIFLTNRILRIVPALAVEVTLCCVILGGIQTTLPLQEYYSSYGFYRYFGNIIGMITLVLPGVFEGNPFPNVVNGNLWTLQPEYYCYLFMTMLMVTGIVYNRVLYSLIFGFAVMLLTIFNLKTGFGRNIVFFPPWTVVYYFFVGIFMYHWRHKIPLNVVLFLICAALSYVMISRRLTFVVAFPLAYCMLYVGMQKIPPIPLLSRGDYSYGVYLFSFPIQQTLVLLFPSLREWWALFLVATPLTIAFAALSWHLFEKPTLKLKKHLSGKPASAPVTNVA